MSTIKCMHPDGPCAQCSPYIVGKVEPVRFASGSGADPEPTRPVVADPEPTRPVVAAARAPTSPEMIAKRIIRALGKRVPFSVVDWEELHPDEQRVFIEAVTEALKEGHP
jgi:hypothetical protein